MHNIFWLELASTNSREDCFPSLTYISPSHPKSEIDVAITVVTIFSGLWNWMPFVLEQTVCLRLASHASTRKLAPASSQIIGGMVAPQLYENRLAEAVSYYSLLHRMILDDFSMMISCIMFRNFSLWNTSWLFCLSLNHPRDRLERQSFCTTGEEPSSSTEPGMGADFLQFFLRFPNLP